MCELGEALFESGSSIALLQELYTSDVVVRCLPGGILVFTVEGGNSPVLVVDPELSCNLVKANEVCLHAD